MKKTIIIILALITISGCSSKPPLPPEPVGDFTPVNPDEVYLSELSL